MNRRFACNRAFKYITPDEDNFFLTYGDGVSNINIKALYEQHVRSGKLLTISAVHPKARFGEMILDGNDVLGFEEKPAQGCGYINGGYMVVSRKFVEKYLNDDINLIFERAPMQQCAADGQMQVFRHRVLQCLDNSGSIPS